jgi:hypothetical protein
MKASAHGLSIQDSGSLTVCRATSPWTSAQGSVSAIYYLISLSRGILICPSQTRLQPASLRNCVSGPAVIRQLLQQHPIARQQFLSLVMALISIWGKKTWRFWEAAAFRWPYTEAKFSQRLNPGLRLGLFPLSYSWTMDTWEWLIG